MAQNPGDHGRIVDRGDEAQAAAAGAGENIDGPLRTRGNDGRRSSMQVRVTFRHIDGSPATLSDRAKNQPAISNPQTDTPCHSRAKAID